jgi:RNA polymerase sigma-70 factor (ECF subfamily)
MTEVDPVTIERARQGDLEAFGDIVRFYQAPVLSTIYRTVGGLYPDEVEDLGQELFIKVFKAMYRFDPNRGVKFSTWLFASVKNLCYDHLRKRRLPTESLEKFSREEIEKNLFQVASKSRPPSDRSLDRETGRMIARAVGRLPIDQRMAFVLREYEKFSYEEIAQITGSTIGTVKSRLFRAKENLRYMLSDYVRID